MAPKISNKLNGVGFESFPTAEMVFQHHLGQTFFGQKRLRKVNPLTRLTVPPLSPDAQANF